MTWKKRCVSLIVCFALIVSITVVRPPKAEAIAFEAGIAVPIILAVAIASGITFLSEGMTESGLTEYIGQQLQQYATDLGTTVSEWWDGLGTLGKNDSGQVILAPPFYRGIQNFLSWWKADAVIDEGVQNVHLASTPSSVLLDGVSFPYVQANSLKSSSDYTAFNEDVSSFPYIPLNMPFPTFATEENPFTFTINGKLFEFYNGEYNETLGQRVIGFKTENGTRKSLFSTFESYYFFVCSLDSASSLRFCYYADGDNYARVVPVGYFKSWALNGVGTLSASQNASYDALELQDDESVALDLGATVEAGATLEDILADYLAKIVDNTATAAQEVTTDSGEGEGDDDDTAPYLPFIPRIWEKLQGLPDDIADKVHDLFVPSAAFVEALPAEFADVFDSRCGLLTYPAALLADFLTRLATLTAQEPVLRWGNINEPFSDRQLVAAGSYNLNSAIQTEAMQTVYNVYMICVKAAVAFWFVELCKRKYEKIIRS